MRSALEDDGDLRDAPTEAFPGAQVERHTGPPTRINVESDRREGVRLGSLGDPVFFEESSNGLAALPTRRVLAPDRVASEIPGNTIAERPSFSIRICSAENDTGSSMAVSASNCSRWFWITSRAASMPS